MYRRVYDVLKAAKAGTEDETNGRHVIAPWAIDFLRTRPDAHMLDVGAGYGADLLAVRSAVPQARLSAVEGFPNAVAHLKANGVAVTSINLERDPLPFADGTFDLVSCNQVFEHLKDIFWLLSEIGRVTKDDGRIILGVPNLGALHNRVALMLGKQPPAIHVVGPHVRGFTNAGFRSLLEDDGFFAVEKIAGGNFYPFPPGVSRPLSRVMPGLAVSSFFFIRKARTDAPYVSILSGPRGAELADTPYYKGHEVAG